MPPCCPSCIHQSLEPVRDHRGKVVDPRPAMFCSHKKIHNWIGFRFICPSDPDLTIRRVRMVSKGLAMCRFYMNRPMQMALGSYGVRT